MKLEVQDVSPKLVAKRVQLIDTDDGVIVRRGVTQLKVTGDAAGQVVRQIFLAAANGVTPEQLYDNFPAAYRSSLEALVQRLRSHRLVVPEDGNTAEPLEAESSLDVFYWHFDEATPALGNRLAERELVIVGVNQVSRQLAATLTESGMERLTVVDYPLLSNLRFFGPNGQLEPKNWPAPLPLPVDHGVWSRDLQADAFGLLVVTVDFGGQAMMRDWNKFALKAGIPFLPVLLHDMVGYIGPLVVPGESACYECLRLRENANLENSDERRAGEAHAFEGQIVTGFHPAMATALGAVAALEIERFLGKWMRSRLVGTLLELNWLASQMTQRRVLKVPYCPACGALQKRAPISLQARTFMPGNGRAE